MKALTLHCRLVFSNHLGTDHISRLRKNHSKILAMGTSPHTTAFCQPSSSCWCLLTSTTDVQCDILWPLYTEAGLPQDAWLLSWLLITTFRRGNSIRKALHAVATYFNNTEAEKHRNLWPENSLAGQRALSTEHSLALTVCVPPGLPLITSVHKTKQTRSKSFTVCLDCLMKAAFTGKDATTGCMYHKM